MAKKKLKVGSIVLYQDSLNGKQLTGEVTGFSMGFLILRVFNNREQLAIVSSKSIVAAFPFEVTVLF